MCDVIDWALPLYGALSILAGLIGLIRRPQLWWLALPVLAVGLVLFAYLPARLIRHPWECLAHDDEVCTFYGIITLTAIVLGPIQLLMLGILTVALLERQPAGPAAEPPESATDYSRLPRYPGR